MPTRSTDTDTTTTMPEPCKQDDNIKDLRGELRDLLVEIRNDQRRSVGLLENMARQDERIKAMAEIITRHEKGIDSLYDRVRKIERAPGQAAGKAWWIVFGIICSIIGAAITAAVTSVLGAHHG